MQFGDSEAKVELDRLKRQLSGKDAQISSVENELFKLRRDYDDIKRSKADAVYELSLEAEKLKKTDELLTTTQAELKSYRLRLANADAALITAQEEAAENLRSARRDTNRSEESGMAGAHALEQARAGQAKLADRVKALERDLAEAKAAGAAQQSQQSQLPVRSGLPVAQSRLPMKGGRRRSSSTSTFSNSSLQPPSASGGAPPSEVDSLKQKLAKATRDLLVAQNSQIAAERQLKREREEAADKLEDVREELERAGWERKALEETLRSTTNGGVGTKTDAFGPVERGKLLGQVGVLEGRLAAIQATVDLKDEELKRLTVSSTAEITSLAASISTLTTDLTAARAQVDILTSDLAASAHSISISTTELAAARLVADDQTARANALHEAITKAETASIEAVAARRDAEARVAILETDIAATGDLSAQKGELEAALATAQTTLASTDSSLAAARSSAADLADQLEASHSACMDAEAEIDRLETLDRDRSADAVAKTAAQQTVLHQVEVERDALQSQLDERNKELRLAQEHHQRIIEVERGSAAETAALLAEATTKLTASEKAVTRLSAKLALKEEETKELARALMEAPAAVVPVPSPVSAAVNDAARSLSDDEKADGSLRLTEEEAEGVKRMESAIARLRSERDGLRIEREELQRSIRFSEAETLAAQEHVVALTQALADEQQEHAALQLISTDTLTLAESLQEELDVARPAVAELEALRDELFRSLEVSDAQLGDVKRAEQEAIALGESLKAQLSSLQMQSEAVASALAAALEAKEAAVKQFNEKEAALAQVTEAEAVLKREATMSTLAINALTEERNITTAALAEKQAALEIALNAAAAAPEAAVRTTADTTALPAQSAPTADVETLIKEKGALEARLQRRNASVEKLQHDLAKLNTAHALLKDSFDDLEEELADLTAEKSTLVDQVAQHQTTQAALAADLETAKSSIQLLETAVSTASMAAPAAYGDEQVAALVSVLFAERAQRVTQSSKVGVSREISETESLLAETAARLEATVEELATARERSVALEAQLASEDRQLHALLDAATTRLETVEAELSAAASRSSLDAASLLRVNTHLCSRLDSTTANLNARAIEVLVARSSMRSLLADLDASNVDREALASEANALRIREADHLDVLERRENELQSVSEHLQEVQAAQSRLAADNAALQTQLDDAQAKLEATRSDADAESQTSAAAASVIAGLEAEVSRLTALVADTSTALADRDAAVARAIEDVTMHSQRLDTSKEAKLALELQISNLQHDLNEIRDARDQLLTDQVAFKDEIASLKATLAAEAPDANRSVDGIAEVEARFDASEAKHIAALALLQEAEEAISSLQSQLTASEDALAAMRAIPIEQAVPDVSVQMAESEAAHRSLIASHEETVTALAAARQSELALQEEAASRRAQLDDVLDGLSKLQQDHASILQAKSIAESHVSQIVASKEEAVRQLNEDHAKALTLLERAKAVKAEQAQDLECELKAAKASLQEAVARSEAQDTQLEQQEEALERLRQEAMAAKEVASASAASLASAETAVRQLEADKAAAIVELEVIRRSSAEQTSVIQDRERLHTETTQKIDQLEAQIAAIGTKLEAAELRLGRQKARHDEEIAAFERSLAEASAASGSPSEGSAEQRIVDLEDHVERLIASLDQKNVEVEEADDKIISMLKEKKKFERRIELLQKKLDKATAAAPPAVAVVAPLAPSVTRAPPSPLNPSAATFVSASPARPTVVAAAPTPVPAPAATPKAVVNLFAPSPAGRLPPLHQPSPSVSSSVEGAAVSGFTPISHRPIASSRRVSAEYASSGPGTPRSRVSSAPAIPSPRQPSALPSRLTFANENVPPPSSSSSSSIGTKRSRPAELEQLGPSAVTAILAPAPSYSPGTILSPASGNTPRRAAASQPSSLQPSTTTSRKTELKGFTPKRSVDRPRAPSELTLAAGVQSRLGGLTLGKEGIQQSTGGLKASSGDLMSRLAAMRR